MEFPLVSIVVVSYNHAHFLKENLDSIKAQTYPNIQLIVADDASKDSSVEVYENWLKENRYPAIKNFHKENKGLANTLNECIDLVEGKYVKFIAADDYLHPESVEKCVKELENLDSGYAMVFTDVFTVDNSSSISEEYLNYHDKSIFNAQLDLKPESVILANRIIAPTTLVKTSIIKETGKYEPDFLLEDYERWLKILQKYKIRFIPEKLCYYRRHEENVTQKRKEQIIQEDTYLKIKYFQHSKELINIITDRVYKQFINKRNLPVNLKKEYLKFKHRNIYLSFFIKYNLHPKIYLFLFKLKNSVKINFK